MRYHKLVCLGAIIAALSLSLTAKGQTPPSYATGSTGISGSPHNLNNVAGITVPQGQICVVCHTPHGASSYVESATPGLLMWNHSTTPGKAYTLYNGGTSTNLDDNSRLCLSCHDGAIAVDAYGGASGTTYMSTIVDSNNVAGGGKLTIGSSTSDLSNSHPVGVSYPGVTGATAGASYGSLVYTLKGGAWTSTGLNNPNNFPAGGVTLVALGGGSTNYGLGCMSCHNPHDYTNKFLVTSNAGSAICRTCHNFRLDSERAGNARSAQNHLAGRPQTGLARGPKMARSC